MEGRFCGLAKKGWQNEKNYCGYSDIGVSSDPFRVQRSAKLYAQLLGRAYQGGSAGIYQKHAPGEVW